MRHLGLSVVGGAFLLCVATLSSLAYRCDAFSTGVQRVFVSTPTKANPRLVQDCMTPNPVTLRTTDTVDEAIATLLATGFNGAPVIDPVTRNLVGVVSAFDFLSKEEAGSILPFQLGDDPSEQKEMAKLARKIVATTVADLMTEASLTVPLDMTMKEAAEIMLRDRCHRLCVVDEGCNLVGILSTSDVMRNVMNTVLQALPEGSNVATQSGGVADDMAAEDAEMGGSTP
jgi:CBS domain-containing protein